MEGFEEYLIKKKINPAAFKTGDPDRWQDFESLFEKMHPDSFTAQKLFLINAIRRKYPLSAEAAEEPKETSKPKPKVKIPTRRPKTD